MLPEFTIAMSAPVSARTASGTKFPTLCSDERSRAAAASSGTLAQPIT
jgi:hypothetical protein